MNIGTFHGLIMLFTKTCCVIFQSLHDSFISSNVCIRLYVLQKNVLTMPDS